MSWFTYSIIKKSFQNLINHIIIIVCGEYSEIIVRFNSKIGHWFEERNIYYNTFYLFVWHFVAFKNRY